MDACFTGRGRGPGRVFGLRFLAIFASVDVLGCATADPNHATDGVVDGAGDLPGGPPPPGCGNGTVDPGEECEGRNLGGANCAFATLNARPNGTLSCSPQCQLDASRCTSNGDPGPGTGGGGPLGS
ncbi:MAG TPA: hypothetical protein VHE30_20570 [Polyangiaceae bacterium]|nr:hypothetical protein [Polyangiaceae bacterium]